MKLCTHRWVEYRPWAHSVPFVAIVHCMVYCVFITILPSGAYYMFSCRTFLNYCRHFVMSFVYNFGDTSRNPPVNTEGGNNCMHVLKSIKFCVSDKRRLSNVVFTI